ASDRPPAGGAGMRAAFFDPLKKREEHTKQQRDSKRKDILEQKKKKDRQEGLRTLHENPPAVIFNNAGAIISKNPPELNIRLMALNIRGLNNYNKLK
ncbi:MAG: hypothetical protein ACK55I_02865, partial [bacterium]